MPPVGPYKSFDTCVAAQKRKGKSEEAARKICGEIQKKSHKSSSNKNKNK